MVSHKNSNGTSVVGLILENGESVMLRVPMSLWRKGDAKYERDFHRIDEYWLAHRGGSWHRVPPRRPSHQFRSEARWFAVERQGRPPRSFGLVVADSGPTPI